MDLNASLGFDPLVPLPLLAVLAGLALLLTLVAAWRRGRGWWLRGLAFLCLLAALAGPSLQREERDGLSDIAFLVIDQSASQGIEDRTQVSADTAAQIEAELRRLSEARPGEAPVETRIIHLAPPDGVADDPGTRLMTALSDAAAEVAPDRIAGAILVTDGEVHDPEVLTDFPAPVHVLLTGRADEWDRRLKVETAPAFGIVGEDVTLRVSVEALGRTPASAGSEAEIRVAVDGEETARIPFPVGRTVDIPVRIAHGGANVIQLTTPVREGELTDRNNSAVITVNGVRDRLRVLLVSGEPHPGERTWRNLLKADPSVDLVHFTILRPPEKQDGVPVFELSLIAFPTRELFMDKIDEFDLIIFDRYRRRGVLPRAYLANVARYVEEGGAVLVASGPAYAGIESLHRTPIREVLPAEPTARILEQGFRPHVSRLGFRHPVTEGLEGAESADDTGPTWGRWFRLIEMQAERGETVMEGPGDRPLLVLDRPGKGRVAMLASDHAWLWSRGYEGGGPQAELLRRLAHWLMKEPELEEEALTASVSGAQVTVNRRSLKDLTSDLTVESPSGETASVPFTLQRPGRWTTSFTADEQGLYRLSDEAHEIVVAVGPPSPREFENPISTGDILAPLVTATEGGIVRLASAGVPEIRRVREDRLAAGRGWIGLAEREAYTVRDISLTPLAPGWLMLVLAAALTLGAWRFESR
ncbi:hypothetical protein FDP22_02845 [Paroceanicella profunda]|uniref:Glutamine amidotransferase domain-containing protein n=1 Tax=Paroceanicella profunda TaxID=2579971 RepID=A0A5B8G2X5_9RHOB|nr:hypothetical protein [Paroceanicella profunda]QDL93562.1 hypothetical protein FDP22_02845 [Paroceanicella profunda]